MKNTILLFLLIISAHLSQAQYAKILSFMQFSNLENKIDEQFGTKEHPIGSGAFMEITDKQKIQERMFKLHNSYRWPNGQKINFSKRSSTKGGSLIIDCYTLVNPATKDTLLLYVDPYILSEKFFIPKGLIATTSGLIKSEIEPVLTQIEELNKCDREEDLKLHTIDILRYIGGNYNQALLIDQDRLKILIEDKALDKSLVGVMMRSYIFNKFYALAKDIPNEQEYAYQQMKLSFEKYLKNHPETVTGELRTKM